MKVHRILTIPALLAAILFYSAACESTVNNNFEESLAPYLELEAIQGASNTTITIRKGDSVGMESYFAFDVSNISNNAIVKEGLKEGWCLEWHKPIGSNGDIHRGIDTYSTYGSETWKPLNYLLSIKNQLKAEDPSLTYKEIQVSIWSLIEEPRFDLDQVMASGNMPSRMLTNGQPNFSIEKVKAIIKKVRLESSNYTYSASTPYLIYAHTNDNSQNGGFLTCDNPSGELCEGFYSITGSVYIDANSSSQKDSNESGAQNVSVTVIDQHGNEISQTTSSDGSFSFTVFTGDKETQYTLEVRETNSSSEDFNEQLFDSHSSTTPVTQSITIDSENITGIHFGFTPQVAKLIQEFENGTILLNTEEPKFWRKQLLLAINSIRTPGRGNTGEDIPAAEVSSQLLIGYLTDIENLLLDNPFQFGSNKLKSAYDILNKPAKTDLEKLLVQLLTAELNVLSGRGSGSLDLDLALMAFGESAAVELSGGSIENNLINRMMLPGTKSSLQVAVLDAEPLLRTFNLSGGGGGGIGPR